MDPHRKFWNQQQQELQRALARPEEHQRAIALFLDQHAMLHSAKISQSKLWSFEDEVWQGLTDSEIRWIPPGDNHSMAWMLWHIARIEDVAMNMLVAGKPQLLHRGHWSERLKLALDHTGNAMDDRSIAQLSATIDLKALRAYRMAVGRETRKIVQRLDATELKQRVDPARLQRVKDAGAVIPEASAVTDYWGGRTIAGLLLMPATRHNVLHLNEALRLKQKILRMK